MIRVEVIPPDDIFAAIQETARTSPTLMRTALKRTIRARRRLILKKLKIEPGPPQYPLRWESERQRRAFFATNGFGKGIPYQRTGNLLDGWTVEDDITTRGGSILIYNDTPYSEYVVGDRAQRMHLDTGWQQAAPILAEENETLEDALIETWFTVSDPWAGVPQ